MHNAICDVLMHGCPFSIFNFIVFRIFGFLPNNHMMSLMTRQTTHAKWGFFWVLPQTTRRHEQYCLFSGFGEILGQCWYSGFIIFISVKWFMLSIIDNCYSLMYFSDFTISHIWGFHKGFRNVLGLGLHV